MTGRWGDESFREGRSSGFHQWHHAGVVTSHDVLQLDHLDKVEEVGDEGGGDGGEGPAALDPPHLNHLGAGVC